MDELERRLAALELWAIEVGARLDPQTLDDAERSILAGLDPARAPTNGPSGSARWS